MANDLDKAVLAGMFKDIGARHMPAGESLRFDALVDGLLNGRTKYLARPYERPRPGLARNPRVPPAELPAITILQDRRARRGRQR